MSQDTKSKSTKEWLQKKENTDQPVEWIPRVRPLFPQPNLGLNSKADAHTHQITTNHLSKTRVHFADERQGWGLARAKYGDTASTRRSWQSAIRTPDCAKSSHSNQTMTLRALPRPCRSVSMTTPNPWMMQKDPWGPPTFNPTELNLQGTMGEYSHSQVCNKWELEWKFYLLLKVLWQC